MSIQMPNCKITVLKRTINHELIEEYLDDEYKNIGPCDCFQDGQEFIFDTNTIFQKVPENFCIWAWADIRKEILTVATGGDFPGLKKPGMAITGCTDWFRPVIFKIERLAND